jgi:hypothetical protein
MVDDEELIREAISSSLTSAATFATNIVGVMTGCGSLKMMHKESAL